MAERRVPDLRRRRAFREPQRRFVIVCEGQNTEPAYFRALRDHLGDVNIDIQLIPAAGVPMTIAERAVELLSAGKRERRSASFAEHDEVWAMFDRDTHPQYAEAARLCVSKGVGVARSNPCFELWLILHFSAFEKPDGHDSVQRHFASICSDYDQKKKRPDCSRFVRSVVEAEARAESQLRARAQEGNPFGPPSTTVFELTRAIRKAAALSRGS